MTGFLSRQVTWLAGFQGLVLPAITAVVALVVYWFSIAPDLTWANYGGDGGELIAASYSLGIPHPPGYPSYVLIGKLFSSFPVGTIAFRYNLLSAVSMATASAFVCAIAANIYAHRLPHVRGSRIAAVACGLVFAFIPIVWGQALIAEVYALNAALLAISLWILLQRVSMKRAIAGGLFLGLSITMHLTSWLMLPLALFLVPRSYWKGLFAGLLIGLSPFLLLPLFADSTSQVAFGRTQTLSGWWWYVSASLYRPNLMSLAPDNWLPRLAGWASSFLQQFAWFGLPLLALGFFAARGKNRSLYLAIFASSILYAIYSFGYRTDDAALFFLPGILLLAILLVFGMKSLGRASLALPLLLVALNFGGQSLRDDGPIREAAERFLDRLPASAIVVTPGDQSASALWYFQQVEETRTDVVLVDTNVFQFDWYRERLKLQNPHLKGLQEDDLVGFVNENRIVRPVCSGSLVDPEKIICYQPHEIVEVAAR